MRLKSHYRLLDIGCGTGEDALIYSPLCAQVTGVDICQHSCWDTVKSTCGNLHFHCTDFMEFNDDNDFNVIVDNGCLHHQTSDEIPTYLNKVRSSLTHDGCFVSSTFYDPDKLTYTDDYCRIHHYFSIEDLDEKFDAAGFQVTDSIMLYRPKYQNYYRITFCSVKP
ncbi:cyclopropane fatty acyl phospholipid synthase [compost metagenome]